MSDESNNSGKCTGTRRGLRVSPEAEARCRLAAERSEAFQSRPELVQAVEAMRQHWRPAQRMLERMQRQAERAHRAVEQMRDLESRPVRRTTDEARRSLERIRWMAEEAGKRMGPWLQMAEEVGKRAEPWMRLAEEAGRRMGESWESRRRMVEAAAPQYQRVLERWAEFERRYQIAEEQAAPILARYKWFITPSLPMPLVFEVVKEGRKPGRRDKAINRLFVDYFAADNWQALDAMVGSWGEMPLLRKRMRVLRDCVKTLQAADGGVFNAANVVLPTLIAQIDGLLTDYLDFKGVKWEKLFEDFGEGPRAKVGRKSQFRKHRNTLLRGPLDEVACYVFLDILLQKAQPGRPLDTPFWFSRHKVMHGENVTYGKKAYVVRAFLALDYLACLQ